jgi:hypothetical protein
LAECEDDYCPEGTYFDGWSCYDCAYCVNTNDDSACDSPNDCCGACGGSASDDCNGALSNGNISFGDTKAKINAAQGFTHNPLVTVNIATGEMTYSDDYVANRAVSYSVTVSCELCFDVDGDGILDDWSGSWSAASNEFLVFGFEADEDVCITVQGSSTELGITDVSDAVCAQAGGCADADQDGVCDDVDDCVGEYDDCGVCNGEGSTECWDGSSTCGDEECPDECTAGDANGDGTVNVPDIVILVNYILSGGSSSDAYGCADMNNDGVINILDVVLLVGIILG